MLAMLERIRLLIIDDWGPEPLNAEQHRDLLEKHRPAGHCARVSRRRG
jgi:DNA replication protein DnaC